METTDRIVICMGSSCFARGNRKNLELVERYLETHGLHVQVELAGSRCEEFCRLGPNVEINGTMHHSVDTGTMIDLLHTYFKLKTGK